MDAAPLVAGRRCEFSVTPGGLPAKARRALHCAPGDGEIGLPCTPTVTLAEAKEQLDALVAEVGRGGEVVITRDDRPVAKLAPPPAPAEDDASPETSHDSRFGLWEGKITLKDGWDEPLEEMRPYSE